jgi:hypothetical protein
MANDNLDDDPMTVCAAFRKSQYMDCHNGCRHDSSSAWAKAPPQASQALLHISSSCS